MTNKQIIIDGCDVSGCEWIREVGLDSEYICTCNSPNKTSGYCKDNPNCHYKNWQRKEQECEMFKRALKNKTDEYNKLAVNYDAYVYMAKKKLQEKEQECEELKKANLHIENNREHKANKLDRIEKLILACTTGYTDKFIQELLVVLHEPEPVSFENKYLQTLAEIKEIAERGFNNSLCNCGAKADLDLILQKIKEVIDDKSNG